MRADLSIIDPAAAVIEAHQAVREQDILAHQACMQVHMNEPPHDSMLKCGQDNKEGMRQCSTSHLPSVRFSAKQY